MSFYHNLADLSPDVPTLGPISDSKLLNRRSNNSLDNPNSSISYVNFDSVDDNINLNNLNINSNSTDLLKRICSKCFRNFVAEEPILQSLGKLYHKQCFVCVQCFQPFQDNEFFVQDGRMYCEYDFMKLFGSKCKKCKKIIIGRVIKAVNANWHPECFQCIKCERIVNGTFVVFDETVHCKECYQKIKEEKEFCPKCQLEIEFKPLTIRGKNYHPYHFNCDECGVELNENAKEISTNFGLIKSTKLLCARCYMKSGITTCAACKTPIEDNRSVVALGKHWHVEHFVCIVCQKPFNNNPHYEKNGEVYCLTHFHVYFGNLCYVCNKAIPGNAFTALNKAWCIHHFRCTMCDKTMDTKTKFHNMDGKPVCKKCYQKFPKDLVKRLTYRKYLRK